jgi:hypothetical protein
MMSKQFKSLRYQEPCQFFRSLSNITYRCHAFFLLLELLIDSLYGEDLIAALRIIFWGLYWG